MIGLKVTRRHGTGHGLSFGHSLLVLSTASISCCAFLRMPWIYHELQEAALCGVHCLNNLLQGPYFGATDLMEIALQLDAQERSLMAELGTETDDFQKFSREESGNVGLSGDFSAGVLQSALEKVWNLTCEDTRAPERRKILELPNDETGFLCHLEDHWIALRKIDGSWWNLNSLEDRPQYLSDLYLGVFLKQLELELWTIYVVRGSYPVPPLDRSGQYWRHCEPGTTSDKRQRARSQEDIYEAELAAALAASLQDAPTQTPASPIASVPSAPPFSEEEIEDEELRLAIELSKQAEAEGN